MDNLDRVDEWSDTDFDLEREDFKFSDLKLSADVVRALEQMHYIVPTPVQRNTIEPALERKDLIVLSKTGSGKTAAFGVPAVQLLHEKKLHKVLVLAPTRELAVQVEQEIASIARFVSVKSIVVYGKHSIDVEIEKMKKGCDILVGTPGRVLDHIEQKNFNPRDFDLVILDEADRMLDMGFIDQVDKIISHTSKQRTMFLFSATIPEEIVRLSTKYLNHPYTIELSSDVKTVEEVEQSYIRVGRNEKRTRLLDVLNHYNPESCIVFCNTRHEVDRVTDFLVNRGIASKSIHGANSQSLRLKFLNQFKKGDFRVLVATDVAARGLHIEGLELVVNYNIPVEKDSYVHRIGRTGRAGKKGLAVSFVQEGELYQMFSLEEHVGVRIEETQLPKHSIARKEAEHARDLYGIAFRELSKYDPEATESASSSREKTSRSKNSRDKNSRDKNLREHSREHSSENQVKDNTSDNKKTNKKGAKKKKHVTRNATDSANRFDKKDANEGAIEAAIKDKFDKDKYDKNKSDKEVRTEAKESIAEKKKDVFPADNEFSPKKKRRRRPRRGKKSDAQDIEKEAHEKISGDGHSAGKEICPQEPAGKKGFFNKILDIFKKGGVKE